MWSRCTCRNCLHPQHDRRRAAGAKMKPGAILINAARGTVVDIDALARPSRASTAAAPPSTCSRSSPRPTTRTSFESPLRGLDNVILTPHIGGSTWKRRPTSAGSGRKAGPATATTAPPLSSVNFPEVALPAHPGKHRLLHIHRNVPGVLSEINRVFCRQQHQHLGAQYLQTNEAIGYVVIDVDAESSELALASPAHRSPGRRRGRASSPASHWDRAPAPHPARRCAAPRRAAAVRRWRDRCRAGCCN
jgi:D-3-phosphoglycerate dehydrogenase